MGYYFVYEPVASILPLKIKALIAISPLPVLAKIPIA
jgi:hypothetical protein